MTVGETPLRFGLIGLGAIGAVRAAALRKTAGCVLTAVADSNASRQQQCPRGVRYFTSPKELLASGVCDAVIVSTPPDTHTTLAIMAMEHGHHVLVEKPMAPSVAACREMISVAKAKQRVLTVGFNHRYFAAIKAVRYAVRSGLLGRVSHVRGYAGHLGLSEFKASWMYDKGVMGGGALMDNGIHLIDLVAHLMGEITSVSGLVTSAIWSLPDIEDNGVVLLRAKNGVTGALEASWSEWKGYRFHIEVYGDLGMARAYYAPMSAMIIRMDRPGGRRRVTRKWYPEVILRERLWGWQDTAIGAFVEELEDFRRLATGAGVSNIIATADDGLRAVEIADAAYVSSRDGEVVRLDLRRELRSADADKLAGGSITS